MEKSRVTLISLMEVLLDKGILTTEDADKIKDVKDLVTILVHSGIVTQHEVDSLQLIYEGFLNEVVQAVKGPSMDREKFEHIKRKFGSKFPRIVAFLGRTYDGENLGSASS